MDDGNVFRVATSDCIEKTQLANTKGSDDGRDAFDTSISISCVAFGQSVDDLREHCISATCVEFVDVANPVQTSFGNVIQGNLTESTTVLRYKTE